MKKKQLGIVFLPFLFLSLYSPLNAQKQKEINWAIATNTVISGINYYYPLGEFVDYYHISPLTGYSAVLDMSVPFRRSKHFSCYANLGYLKSGFKGKHYVRTLEDDEDAPYPYKYRQEEWSNINFNHLTLGGFIGFKKGKINLQLGGKILYLIRTIEQQQTVFLTAIQTAQIFENPERFPIQGFRKWDIGPQMNIEVFLWKDLFLNTSFYYGSNETTATPSALHLEKRFYIELGLKYYFL